MTWLANLSPKLWQYLLITGNYWAFTLTDGALRMLVVLYFYGLGYSPFDIAMLFVFYEIFGVVTNLVGGWLGARLGLNKTMNIGLFLQIASLAMLLVPVDLLVVPWVMAAQAISGIGKDLNKMSAKSSIKMLVPSDAQGQLYKWIAILTGSKNALKGIGFFMGGALLALFGFRNAILIMAVLLSLVWLVSLVKLKKDIGKSKAKPKFTEIFSKSKAINVLSAARLFLFGARDVWFVVALPVYLSATFGWSHFYVGGFLAIWVIGYGFIQGIAPKITGTTQGQTPDGKHALMWALLLSAIPALIAMTLVFEWHDKASLIIGLLIFGGIFAVNSSLHSFLIVSYAGEDGVSLDVGFYYMANAMGRLIGTVLSGWLYQNYGLTACLWFSTGFVALAAMLSIALPRHKAIAT
jgi:predicted MFS family arabinose efflux permease